MLSLLKGDCLEVMKTLSDKSIDCFICDLPYGVLTQPQGAIALGHKKLTPQCSGCAWDIKIDLKKFWEQVKRLAKSDNTPVIMFCNTKFGAELINSNPDWFRYDLVWSKSNGVGFLSANKMPLRSHEMIYIFSKKGAYYKRVDITGDFPKGGGGRSSSSVYPSLNALENIQTTKEGIRCVKSVVEVANKKGKNNHPTQKPAELYRWLLERYCPKNGTVLDPTAGSYTSCFTAKELGLKSIGIEKDSKFFWHAVSKVG